MKKTKIVPIQTVDVEENDFVEFVARNLPSAGEVRRSTDETTYLFVLCP